MKAFPDIQSVECPEPVEGLCFVYVLLFQNGSFYVGQTRDVAKRVNCHAAGFGSRQAKQLKKFILVYVEGPMDPQASFARERQLKKWSRAKKQALIEGDVDSLKRLSKSRQG